MYMTLLTLLHAYGDAGALVLRLAVGLIFIRHGVQKWQLWKATPSPSMPPRLLMTLRLLSLFEPAGGIAVTLGLLTQIAAFGLGLIMLGALYFKIRVWKIKFIATDTTGWEFDLVLLAAAIVLTLAGGGAWALDRLLGM